MGRVQLVMGDAGMGNSVLLADLVRTVTSAGIRVLPVTGKCRLGQFVTVASDRHAGIRRVIAPCARGRHAQATIAD